MARLFADIEFVGIRARVSTATQDRQHPHLMVSLGSDTTVRLSIPECVDLIAEVSGALATLETGEEVPHSEAPRPT